MKLEVTGCIVRTVKLVLLAALLGLAAGGNAWADRGMGHGHGGFHHDGFHHGARVGVVIGGPLFWPPYPYYYPYYPYYGYGAPTVVVPAAPPTYIEQGQEAADPYWYFCRNPKGYYPYVKECSSGWQQVLPQPPAGN